MRGETGGTSETGHSKGSEIGHGPSHEEVDRPIVGRPEPKFEPEYIDPSEGSGPVRRVPKGVPELLRSDPVKETSDKLDPVRGLSAWEVELIGLVGSTEVPALMIPSDNSRRVTRTEFDLDKIWRYDAVGYDKNRVFLTEKNAYLDHLTSNSLATDWVLHHSDAAKDPDSHLPSPQKLYGPVYVVARDPIMEWITQSSTQLNKLKHALEWIDPFRPSD